MACSRKIILAAGTVANQMPKFKKTSAKLYAPLKTLTTQENIKLLEQEYGFKRTINWNKYHSQVKLKTDI